MGKIMSIAVRPFKNFNLESRAHRIISRDKPVAAPKHKSDQIDYERIMNEYPAEYEDSLKKNEQLDKYLKDIYVKSHDPVQPSPKIIVESERPLPLNRKQVEDFEYGVKEPQQIPQGRTTLKKALQFITDHHQNHKLHSAQKIANDYLIPEETVNNILKYYRPFEVYVPEQRKVKARFAGPSVPRIQVIPNPRKRLSAAKQDTDGT